MVEGLQIINPLRTATNLSNLYIITEILTYLRRKVLSHRLLKRLQLVDLPFYSAYLQDILLSFYINDLLS